MVKMVQNGQNGLKWSKEVNNCEKCQKWFQQMVNIAENGQNGLKWSKMAQNGPRWSTMVQMVQIGKKIWNIKKKICGKMVWNGQKWSKMVLDF